MDASFRREEERIRSASADRTGAACSAESVVNRFQLQERQSHVFQLLNRHGLVPLAGKRILEVGCGTGKWLRDLIAWGADPEGLFGVELLEASAARARRLCPPGVTIECGNAAELSFAPHSFDIVLQATLFTSVLGEEVKRAMATEMLRVLHPQGVIIWYDFFFRNPQNPYVKPVTREEIYQLFPGCEIDLRRISLAPALARVLAPCSWTACSVLSRLPPLCTHYLGAICRPSTLQ
jgi:SAM-dependent methyltransferase